tara:strand:+ start:1150 stop:1593 length:444 start_codon:yes stop_codon:yes gene_type:complete
MDKCNYNIISNFEKIGSNATTNCNRIADKEYLFKTSITKNQNYANIAKRDVHHIVNCNERDGIGANIYGNDGGGGDGVVVGGDGGGDDDDITDYVFGTAIVIGSGDDNITTINNAAEQGRALVAPFGLNSFRVNESLTYPSCVPNKF